MKHVEGKKFQNPVALHEIKESFYGSLTSLKSWLALPRVSAIDQAFI